jgi:hypothetical protein
MTACAALVALVAADTWLSTPSLLIFVLGGAFIGAVVGTILKGTSEAVAALSDKGRTAEATAGLFLAIHSGMALPLPGRAFHCSSSVRGTHCSVSARS